MDHIRILRRAFEITRFYRALWVFGILLALTTFRGGGNGGSGSRGSTNVPFPNQFPPFSLPSIPAQVISTLLAFGAVLLCLFLLLGIGFIILRYLSLTALIRMVDGYETSGEKVSVGQGFRLGWSRGAFFTWLANLIFILVGIIAVIVILLLIASPNLLWLTRDNTAGVIGTVISVGLLILFILVLIVVGAFVSLWVELIRREIILGGHGVFDGIRAGWGLFRRHLGDVIIMGLILFGISLVLLLISIPIFLLLAVVGVVAGGLPALLAGGLANIFVHGATPQIIAGLVGVPIFLAVLLIPLLFLRGLVETFFSAAWTLTYRELLAMEAVAGSPTVEVPPAVEPPLPEPPLPEPPLEPGPEGV